MNEKSGKAIKSIGRSIANINRQLRLLRDEYPEAMMYVEDGINYCVMKGPSHTNETCGEGKAEYENVLESFTILHSDCGAW